MEAIETLLTRRSCRSYTSQPLDEKTLEHIVEAGTFAPSGKGRQPWKFVVVTNPDDVAKLSHMNAAIMGTESDPFYGAQTVIVVLVDPAVPTCVEDGSCAICNMLNAAHALGIGSCWIHRAREEFESDEGKELLARWGIEGEWRGVGHVILGYPGEGAASHPEAAPRHDNIVVRVK